MFECLLPHQIALFKGAGFFGLFTKLRNFFLKIISPFNFHNSFMSKEQLFLSSFIKLK